MPKLRMLASTKSDNVHVDATLISSEQRCDRQNLCERNYGHLRYVEFYE